jgi:hypothetical protein
MRQQRSFPGNRNLQENIKLEESVVDRVLIGFRGSRVIEQDVVRRLPS